MARALDVSHQTVSDIEKDRRKLPLPLRWILRLAGSVQCREGILLKWAIDRWECIQLETETPEQKILAQWLGQTWHLMNTCEQEEVISLLRRISREHEEQPGPEEKPESTGPGLHV